MAVGLETFDGGVTAPAQQRPVRRGAEISALKQRDNITNFYYLGFGYAVVAAAVAGCIWSFSAVDAAGLAWGWKVPAAVIAISIAGASQHQLGGAIHEGTHYTLFENRALNEWASDWLAAFPIYTSTFHYRLQHLAHHQFINDPERDPDLAQLHESGHELDFPITHAELLVALLKQLWPPNLIRYTIARARYGSLDSDNSPYVDKERAASRAPVIAGILYAAGMPAVMIALLMTEGAAAAFAVLGAGAAAMLLYFLAIDEDAFPKTHLKPAISHRATAIGRLAYMTLLYGALTAAEAMGWGPAWIWFGLLWVLPLFTAFPLFMIMRQWVQHGNADRGRLTNTRVFLVNPFLRYAVFPFGMDYHLPHHMYASVPHYRLPDLHDLLLKDPEYKEKGRVVEGYFLSPHGSASVPRNPTVIEVLGPAFAPAVPSAAYVDNDAIAEADVASPADIARQAALSERGRA